MVAARYRREAKRRCDEHGWHVSRKRLASCAGGRAAGGVCGTSCGLRRMMKKVARGPWSKQVLTRGAIYMIIGAK